MDLSNYKQVHCDCCPFFNSQNTGHSTNLRGCLSALHPLLPQASCRDGHLGDIRGPGLAAEVAPCEPQETPSAKAGAAPGSG